MIALYALVSLGIFALGTLGGIFATLFTMTAFEGSDLFEEEEEEPLPKRVRSHHRPHRPVGGPWL